MSRKYPIIDIKSTGQNIKRIMLSKNLTVKDIQLYLGLSTPQGIYHWFDGKTLPTLDHIYALSELFNMPIDVILRGNREYRSDYIIQDRVLVYYERVRHYKSVG